MNYSEILGQLHDHARDFHQVLISGNIYTTNIEEKFFLSRVKDELSRIANYTIENNGDLEVYKLNLPVWLINKLSDVVSYSIWDYEFCYDGFFDGLAELFKKTKFKFKWQYDKTTLQLEYSLDNHSWVIENLHLSNEVDFEIYNNILNQVNTYLNKQGFVLYEAVTGDQTGLMIFIPIDSPEIIKDFLISIDDSRASKFYE